jgi:hypothetical protein
MQELDTQQLFETLNLVTENRLGNAELLGGSAKMESLSHSNKIA